MPGTSLLRINQYFLAVTVTVRSSKGSLVTSVSVYAGPEGVTSAPAPGGSKLFKPVPEPPFSAVVFKI